MDTHFRTQTSQSPITSSLAVREKLFDATTTSSREKETINFPSVFPESPIMTKRAFIIMVRFLAVILDGELRD